MRPLFVLLLIVLAACRRGEEPPARSLAGSATGWNVLLLSLDTLRADRLGAYGYAVRPTSPRLDGLLASGVRFASAMAPRASTWPSLATALTGLYPAAHGVLENGYSFPAALPTLPELLAGAGYETGAFLSNMCQAGHRGWQELACSGGQDGKTVRRAVEWARGRDGKRPFLLWVHLFGAHAPYYNGGDAAERLDPGYAGPIGPKKWQLDRIMRERVPLAPRDVAHLDALYDAAVQGSDRLAGALLDGLRAAGRLERTVVVFLSDHGEELYDHHGYLYHACSVYQAGLHVPLGIAAPGLLAARGVATDTVELADVTPTLLALLGRPPLREAQGRSLLPLLERPAAEREERPAFSQYGAEPLYTVLAGGWKLVYNPQGFSPVCIPGAPPDHFPIARAELYDLARDPGEAANLAEREPARVTRLARLIRQRFAGVRSRGERQAIPESLAEELKSLGYAVP
ncbi:MAG TPA: sulfatase [Thermoanaerobaculia bacterium]|nr:sulfatase [Thermoanaerobaculia bacterium]